MDGQAKVYTSRLTPFKCPFCHDLGWVHPDVDYPVDDPRFGKLVKCHVCFDHTSHRTYLLSLANLPANLKAASFENLHYTTAERITAAPLLEGMVDNRRGWLTLWGAYGTGKSYLAACAVNYAIQQGIEARFWEMGSLLNHLRDAYDPKKGVSFSQLFHDICSAPLLVIDEAEVFKPTDWAYTEFRQLVSMRYTNSDSMATIWVLNPEPRRGAPGFPADLDFLASRMQEFEILHLEDDDLRER